VNRLFAIILLEEKKMKKFLGSWRVFLMSSLVVAATIGIFHHKGIVRKVSATNTPQTLPFSQNWTNTALITTNNDWSGVPGIVGYRGDDIVTGTGVDPRTILADGSATPISVIANQTNPDTFTTGAVVEFEITNPSIALNGSGTADVPHIVIHLNTTGQSNIQFACNIRDLDGSVDNATQQVDVQYRVGGAGDYTSVRVLPYPKTAAMVANPACCDGNAPNTFVLRAYRSSKKG
jgi:hypothetical protein